MRLLKKIFLLSKIYFVGALGALLFVLANLILKVRLTRLDVINFGRFVDNYNVLKNNRIFEDDKRIIFWLNSNIISNQYTLELYKKNYKIYNYNFFFFATDRILNMFNNNVILKVPEVFSFEKKIFLKKDKKNINEFGWSFDNHIKFSDDDEKKGENFLAQFNLNKRSKWICIHNRDELYKKKIKEYNADKTHVHRNFDINDMSYAIDVFINNGFHVFRVGSIQSSKMQYVKKNFYDIDNYRDNDGFIQIFLSKYCRAYFGSNSGSSSPYHAFKKPISYINFAPLHLNLFNFFKTLPSIPKKVVCKKTGKYLSLKDLYEQNLIGCSDYKVLLEQDIAHENNSPEDIKDLALEIIDCLENKDHYDKDDIDLQKRYLDIFNKYNKNLSTSLIKYELRPPIKIGKSFLKKNSSWLYN